MKRRLVLALLILAVAALVAFLYVHRRPAEDGNRILVSGNIEITDAEVSFKISGRVEERLVSEGELVKVGQVVARLDTTELAQEVALRKAEAAAAEATLAELEAGSREEEIEQAAAALKRC